jgi:hypothetical protein
LRAKTIETTAAWAGAIYIAAVAVVFLIKAAIAGADYVIALITRIA